MRASSPRPSMPRQYGMAFVLLIGCFALWRFPSGRAASGACSSDRSRPLAFIAPASGQSLRISDAYVFEISPLPGARTYRWVLFQDGVEVTESDMSAGDRSGFGWSYLYSLISELAVHDGYPLQNQSGVLGDRPSVRYAVGQESAAHNRIHAGELTVEVSAEMCDGWTQPETLTVIVQPTPSPRATNLWTGHSKLFP